MIRRLLAIALFVFLSSFPKVNFAQEPINLIDPQEKLGGWRFDNGKEFPGARGGLQVIEEQYHDQPILSLKGNFEEGGNYVQAAIDLPPVPIEVLSFWINVPVGSTSIPIRLIDESGQCHQIRLKINDKGGWQKIVIPVNEYFRNMGTAAALDIARQYQKWSGANDGRWHQPGKLFVVLCSRALGTDVEVLLSDVQLQPSRPKVSLTKTIRLDDMLQFGEIGWTLSLGNEFPGAKGSLDLVENYPQSGQNTLQLKADFTDGGAYIGIRKSFESLNVKTFSAVRLKMRSTTTSSFGLRMVDETGQCHQRSRFPFTADGTWQEVVLIPDEIAGGEHWSGANDGQWHGQLQLIEFMLNTASHDGKQPELEITDIRADAILEAQTNAASYAETFESAQEFSTLWNTTGKVSLTEPGSEESKLSLNLARSLDQLTTKTSATGPTFPVSTGTWQINYDALTDLHSPDNSYQGRVFLELLNQTDQVLEAVPVSIDYGKQNWESKTSTVEIIPGAVRARFRVDLQKTYGTYQLDNLTATRLDVQPVEQKVERILVSSGALGNLFIPGEKVQFKTTVETSKPLLPNELQLVYSIHDYWGVSQALPASAVLAKAGRKDGKFVYTADLSVPEDQLAVGKFYELHVGVPQETGAAATEFSGFSVLPVAVSKNYPAEQIPFTIRNWDSRIADYFKLSDRLGLRMFGVWGGWKSKPPHKPHCPGIDLVDQFEGKWITGTPASQIERNGFTTYTEESLRQGMKNFLEQYADKGMAMIAMGNEPHGKGEKVLENVRAYQAIYETVKAFDPSIHVMGTSVEPNEEYFQAGYQNYLDSYDFHIYEHYTNVRRTMQHYRELMNKYDAVKPIHSTELGLNSQGQTRLAVSQEMIKKIVSFFAEGGDTVSWFTIQYPDPKGKARGQFGDSHCMFDCKYNLYTPRLDAVTHYHLLNAICIKEFVDEDQNSEGIHSYLFKDELDQSLQVMWLDGGRKDLFVPIEANGNVKLVYLDGTEQILTPHQGGVTVTVSDNPIMLLYENDSQKLNTEYRVPDASIEGTIPTLTAGKSSSLLIKKTSTVPLTLELIGPPTWVTQLKESKEILDINFDVPATASAREARVRIPIHVGSHTVGEIEVPLEVETPR